MSDIKELAPCAAPSSEEVKEMVEKLRVIQTVGYRRRAYLAAADLIERLAARVPDGCVVVPREPTEKMIDAVIDERLNALMDSRPHTIVDIYKAMIEVGEVKP